MLWGTIRLPGGRASIVIRPMADGLSEKLRPFRARMHAAQRAITKGPKPAKERLCQELLAPSVVQAHSNSFQSILHQSLAYPRARKGARLRPEKVCHFVAYRFRESNTKIIGTHWRFVEAWCSTLVLRITRNKAQKLCTRIARNLQDQSKGILTKFAFFNATVSAVVCFGGGDCTIYKKTP